MIILDLIMVKASYLWLGTCGAFKGLSWRHLDRQAWCGRQRGRVPTISPRVGEQVVALLKAEGRGKARERIKKGELKSAL